MASKVDIRREMTAKRSAFSAEDAAQACGYLCEKLAAVSLPESSIIAAYSAVRGEVDLNQYVDACRVRNNPVCLPIVTESELIMHFKEWLPFVPLEKGAFGVLEPLGGELVVPNVILVPLVAFDRRGFRLGYGKGYYDATIASLKQNNPALLTIGIAYSFQEVDTLPDEPHDERLDMVVTEQEVIQIT